MIQQDEKSTQVTCTLHNILITLVLQGHLYKYILMTLVQVNFAATLLHIQMRVTEDIVLFIFL